MKTTDDTPPSDYKLADFCIDQARPIKVVAIGAGYSGILAGIRFPQRIKNLDLVIYDSNAGVGGTWYSHRYPGLACDIPSHCYQLTFEPNTDWSAFYAPGPEILKYLEGVVDKYKLRQYIKLQHRVTRAEYNGATGKWHLTIRRPSNLHDPAVNGSKVTDEISWEEFEDTADVVFSGMGIFGRWTWPDIEGIESFKGKMIHSAFWETGEGDVEKSWESTVQSWKDKTVGVIGVGSAALQIVPALQPRVRKLFNYARAKTWVSTTFGHEKVVELTGRAEADNHVFTEDEKKVFQADPEYYKAFRRELERAMSSAHAVTQLGNPLQDGARMLFKENMTLKLNKKPWIADHLIPDFAVCCRRLTPGPGYLEALCEDNVDFISSLIKRVTATGIETIDGNHEDMDILVCATGYDTSFNFRFPIIGRGGVDLKDHYTPHPRTYLSVATDGFPNWFQALGPNSGVGAGSLLIIVERQVDYAVAATLKIQRERLKSMEVKSEAVDDFDKYLDNYFPTTVFGQTCRSWYKSGGKQDGRIVALWPGSSLHAVKALEHPRWEDYNYEYFDTDFKNRFYWLGDGNTLADRDPTCNRAWYLDDDKINFPPVPNDA